MINYNTKHGEIKNMLFTSYSLPGYDKRFRFKIDNIFFKNTFQEKIESVQEIKDGNFIVIDTETNGKNLFGESLPFQFSGIKYQNWKEVKKLNIFINIGKIQDEILKLTHTEQKCIDSGLKPEEAMIQIINFLKGEKIIFAHNAGFDISILNNLFVYTGFIDKNLLSEDILIRDSMQYFYFIYKHLFNCPVTGSSIEFLTNHFFLIKRDPNKAHQADYDCELLKKILEMFNKTLINNKKYIISKIEEDTKRIEYTNFILKDPYNKKTITVLHNLGTSISEDYNDYLSLKEKVDNYKTAIVNFLEKTNNNNYFESIINSFYIKKNIPFETAQYKYLLSYKKESITFTTPFGDLLFFLEEDKNNFFTNIVIKNEKDCLNIIKETTNLIQEMTQMQIKITNKLGIIKAHQSKTGYSNYGDLKAEKRLETRYLDRTANHIQINEDFKKGLIKTIEDLCEYRNYNTNLTIQLIGEGKNLKAGF